MYMRIIPAKHPNSSTKDLTYISINNQTLQLYNFHMPFISIVISIT